jgi:serine/threonine protein kinase
MADRVGQQFGTYQLVSLLAESPIAEVYHGEQRYSHIDVALKLLRRPLATTEEIDAFRSEARTLARLIHPHIVRVLGFDVQDHTGFLVMDYAPGGTCRQRYRGGEAQTLETILPAIKQAADALQYAHEQGVIHQALKPESLLVGHQDEVVLTGFRLASAYPSAESQTPEKISPVTAYLAPEQLQGKPGPASDQYALGMIAYEWLNGAVPFQESGAELAQQILTAAPPPLYGDALTPGSGVERVLMRALAKDPAKRFASIQAFAAALAEAAQAEPAAHLAAASVSAPVSTSRQPVAAARSPAHQAAARPQAGQAPARVPASQGPARAAHPAPAQPPAERFGTQQPQAPWQGQAPAQRTSAQQAWQRPPAPERSARSSNVGCIVAIIVIVAVGLIYLLSTH